MFDSFFISSDFTNPNLFTYFSFFFFNLSDNDENGKFFPDKGEENLFTAYRFVSSSRSLMLRFTFLFSISSSAIATSILSPPTNLDGLASAELIAI